jgi:2-hydroxycyclohexanecarboxyl-CoA dehydrogenase
MDLKGLVAIVTGGGQGIGEATATSLAQLGAKVAILDLMAKSGEAVASRLREAGSEAMAVVADVTVKDQVDRATKEVFDHFGSVDILVNNAGWTETHPFLTEDEAYWDKVIAVNLKGPILASRAALAYMSEKKFGKIVNVGSDAARIGNSGEAVYSAAKGGLVTFTKSLAREVARYNVNVNCVCPGPTNTPLMKDQPEKVIEALKRMMPFRRIAEPDEVANVIAFLCSREADFVTGQIISASGGLTMVG